MNVTFNVIHMARGLAAVVVVLHHISASSLTYFNLPLLNDFFKVGWSGVDFFFVLSGFIITYVHYKDIITGRNFKKFAYKRFVRIYPIYWVIAIVSLFFFIKSGQLSFNNDYLYIIKSLLLIKHPSSPFLGVALSLVFEVFFISCLPYS